MSSGLKGAGPDGSLNLGFGAGGWVVVGVVFFGPMDRGQRREEEERLWSRVLE